MKGDCSAGIVDIVEWGMSNMMKAVCKKHSFVSSLPDELGLEEDGRSMQNKKNPRM